MKKQITSKIMKKIMSPKSTTSQARQGLNTPESVDVFHKGHRSVYSMENRIQRQMGARKMRSHDLTQDKKPRSEWNMWNFKPRTREHTLNMSQRSKAIKAGTPLKMRKG